MNWNNPACTAISTPPTCCLNCSRFASFHNNFLNRTAASGPIQRRQLRRISEVPFYGAFSAVTLLLGQTWTAETDMQHWPGGIKTSVLVPLHLQCIHKEAHRLGNNIWKENVAIGRFAASTWMWWIGKQETMPGSWLFLSVRFIWGNRICKLLVFLSLYIFALMFFFFWGAFISPSSSSLCR